MAGGCFYWEHQATQNDRYRFIYAGNLGYLRYAIEVFRRIEVLPLKADRWHSPVPLH